MLHIFGTCECKPLWLSETSDPGAHILGSSHKSLGARHVYKILWTLRRNLFAEMDSTGSTDRFLDHGNVIPWTQISFCQFQKPNSCQVSAGTVKRIGTWNVIYVLLREKPCLFHYQWLSSYIFKKTMCLWTKKKHWMNLCKFYKMGVGKRRKIKYHFSKIMEYF